MTQHEAIASPAVAKNLERVAWLMDRAIRVPGTNISVGLDALLGLFPVGGDLLTGTVQAALVLVALYHYRVPKAVATRMLANVLIDIAVGSIPLVGDLFDVVFKANTRNLRLLEPYREHGDHGDHGDPRAAATVGHSFPLPTLDRSLFAPKRRGMPWRVLLIIGTALAAALILVIIGLVTVIRWLF